MDKGSYPDRPPPTSSGTRPSFAGGGGPLFRPVEIEGVWGPLLFLPATLPPTQQYVTLCVTCCVGAISQDYSGGDRLPFLFFLKQVRAGASESLRPGPYPFPPPIPRAPIFYPRLYLRLPVPPPNPERGGG